MYSAAVRPNFARKTATLIGSLQIFCGIVCISMHIIGIVIEAPVMFVGAGIWGGAFMIVTGCVGIGAGAIKNNCMIVTFLTISVLSICVDLVPIIQSIFGLWHTIRLQCSHIRDARHEVDDGTKLEGAKLVYYRCMKQEGLYAINALILLFSVIHIILSSWGAALCSKVVCLCCYDDSPSQQFGSTQRSIQQFGSVPPGHVQSQTFEYSKPHHHQQPYSASSNNTFDYPSARKQKLPVEEDDTFSDFSSKRKQTLL